MALSPFGDAALGHLHGPRGGTQKALGRSRFSGYTRAETWTFSGYTRGEGERRHRAKRRILQYLSPVNNPPR